VTTEVITAGALLVNSRGQVLFGRRAAWKKAWPDHWDAIGGRLEDGESPREAVIREVQEEVGVTPTKLHLLDVVREVRPDLYGEGLHYIFAVTAWTGGDPYNATNEHTELGWFTLDDLANLRPLAGEGYERLARLALQAT
jgi:mutator protein MutT